MSALGATASGEWHANAGRSWLPAGLALTIALLAGLSIGIAFVDPVIGLAAFAAIAAGPLAIVAVAWPELVLYGLVAVTALNLSDILNVQHGIPGTGKAIVAVAVLFPLIHALRFGKAFVIDRLNLTALLLYCVLAGLSVFWAHEPYTALAQIDALYRNAIIASLVLVAAGSLGVLHGIVRALFLSLALLAAIAVFQVATGRYDIDFGGLGGADFHHIAGEIDSIRVHGPFADANSFGRALLIGIPFAVYEVICGRNGWWRLAGAACATLLVLGVVLTYSRGAMLGLAAMTLALAWLYRRHWRLQLTLAIPLVVAASLLVPQIYLDRATALATIFAGGQSTRQDDQSILNRLDENALAVRMFTDNVWGGVGPGGYAELFQKYSLDHNKHLRFEDRKAHSLYLEIAAEGGLLALLAFFSFVAVLGYNVVTARQPDARPRSEQAGLATAIGIALIGYLSASTVLHADFSRPFWLLCGMALALPVCARHARNQITQRDLVITIPRLSGWPIARQSNLERAVQ
jgi:O-antigen ligase